MKRKYLAETSDGWGMVNIALSNVFFLKNAAVAKILTW